MAAAHASNLHALVNERFGVDGGPLTSENILHLQQTYKSCVYLCADESGDHAPDGGFPVLEKAFPGQCFHFPLKPSAAPFAAGSDTATLPKPILAVETYRHLEAGVVRLASPCVIICKTTRRAYAVLELLEGVRDGKTADQTLADSTRKGHGFMEVPGLVEWVRTVLDAINGRNPMVFRQLFEKESSTYTYLLADQYTKEAVLIDPVLETADRDAKLLKDLGLNLIYGINTHCHADHITGTHKLREHFPGMKSVIAEAAGAAADMLVKQGDRIVFGTHHLVCLATPGHTSGCMTYVLDDCSKAFTGDALFVRGCGRTDFQQGNSKELYSNIHNKIYKLHDSTKLFPGHDYNGHLHTTVWEEKKYNPRLTKTEEGFVELMAGLNLPYPKKIDASLPANLKDGKPE
jgi:sulfur dioxygenase